MKKKMQVLRAVFYNDPLCADNLAAMDNVGN